MHDYNFWADLLDTYQSFSDVLKALWLIVPPATLVTLTALALRYRLERARMEREVIHLAPMETIGWHRGDRVEMIEVEKVE